MNIENKALNKAERSGLIVKRTFRTLGSVKKSPIIKLLSGPDRLLQAMSIEIKALDKAVWSGLIVKRTFRTFLQ